MNYTYILTITFQDRSTRRQTFTSKREAEFAARRAISSRVVLFTSITKE